MKSKLSKNSALEAVLGSLVLISFVFLLTGCSYFQKRFEKTEAKEYKISIAGKSKIYLSNRNGTIKVYKNTRDSILYINADITYYVTKKELKEPSKGFELKIDTLTREIHISSNPPDREKDFVIGFSKREKINYTLYLPPGIDFDVENVNGAISITDVQNNINGDVKNGNVELENTNGKLKFDVTNGKITASLDSTKGISFDVTNGNINMKLTSSFSGKFNVDWVNGNIKYDDFAFLNADKGKKSFRGQLGDSDTEIRISTVNGKVNLQKK